MILYKRNHLKNHSEQVTRLDKANDILLYFYPIMHLQLILLFESIKWSAFSTARISKFSHETKSKLGRRRHGDAIGKVS